MSTNSQPSNSQDDPILIKRQLISNWASRVSRWGYYLFCISTVAVIWGLVIDFTPTVSRVASVGLIGGSIVLAPAVLVQYSVKAANRFDKENGL